MILLPQAKAHMRVTHNQEDNLIQQYIDGAYQYIEAYLDKRIYPDQIAADDDVDTPEPHKIVDDSGLDQVALFIVAHFYRNREATVVMPGKIQAQDVPWTVEQHLYLKKLVGV